MNSKRTDTLTSNTLVGKIIFWNSIFINKINPRYKNEHNQLKVPVTRKASELELTGRAAWTRWQRAESISKPNDWELRKETKQIRDKHPGYTSKLSPMGKLQETYHCTPLRYKPWKSTFYICSCSPKNKTHGCRSLRASPEYKS